MATMAFLTLGNQAEDARSVSGGISPMSLFGKTLTENTEWNGMVPWRSN